MNSAICIFLCDRSGVAARPWADCGYECWCVDVQHSIRRERVEGLIHFVWGDARSWTPPAGRRIAFMGCFPPCTHVAVSGARDFKAKGAAMLCDALELFSACQLACAYSGAPYFIENPVGVLSSHVRKPDYTFHPWHYGDPVQKQTCLWTGGGFVMPEPLFTVKPQNVKQSIWLMAPSDDRADKRSQTPAGFAKAVCMANAPLAERGAA